MKKPMLSLVFVSLFGLLPSFAADPTNASASAEESDRQFLKNLERADAAKAEAAATTRAPSERAVVSPAQAVKSRPADKTGQVRIVTHRLTDTADFDTARISEPEDTANNQPISEKSPSTVTRVVVSRPVKSHHSSARDSGGQRGFHNLFERLFTQHPEDW